MRISNVVAGFTLGEADLLRKAMGKKNAEVMAKMRGKFVDGAKKLGTNEKKAAHLFDLMEHFAGYGFNKSHSTAYAFLAYQTAYLKANYPWHFAAALLTIEAQNTDKLALYLGECRDRGIPVLPPDINESQLRVHRRAGKGVRFGLTAIKNVGEGAIESLLDGAEEAGAHHVAACAVRGPRPAAGQQARVREPGEGRRLRFARAGRSTERCRPRSCGRGCMAAIDAACEHGARLQRDRLEGQAQLFGGFGDGRRRRGWATRQSSRWRSRLPDATPWTETEQLAFEKETLGLYWSGHPVDRYAAR